MKYLKEFRIFEEVQSDLLYLKDDEIEALPAFKRMVKFLSDLRESIPEDQRRGRASFGPFIWTGSSLARAKGINVLDLWGAQYPFKFNPKNGSLKYGQETVNKNFELPYRTIDDWNRAVEELDKFQLARFLDMTMLTFRSLADPAKLQKWIGKKIDSVIEDNQYSANWLPNKISEEEAIKAGIQNLSVIVPHIMELHGISKSEGILMDFNKMLVEYFYKKIKKDTGRIGEVPEIYRKGVLSKIGYSDAESNSIGALKDIGIF